MARMSVDDSALRDPRIRRIARMLTERFGTDVRNWPDFERRYALGTMMDVWALPYDRVTPIVPHEDVDEVALIDHFSEAMVVAGLGENQEDGLWIKGAKKRIGYLEKKEDNGQAGGIASGESRRNGKPPLPSTPRLALPSGDDTKPSKAKKEPKAKVEGYHETVDYFQRRYIDQYKAKPTWNGKTGRLLISLLKVHGWDEVQRRIDVLFSAPPSFLSASPPDIATLSQHFDKLVAPAGVAKPRGTGRFEPAENLDYSKPPWEP